MFFDDSTAAKHMNSSHFRDATEEESEEIEEEHFKHIGTLKTPYHRLSLSQRKPQKKYMEFDYKEETSSDEKSEEQEPLSFAKSQNGIRIVLYCYSHAHSIFSTKKSIQRRFD